jgi:hypothetical protein
MKDAQAPRTTNDSIKRAVALLISLTARSNAA